MNSTTKSELESIKRELQSIIYELEDISSGVRSNFKGIGTEHCADCIDVVIGQYYYVQRKLNNIDLKKIDNSFKNSGGGRGF